MAASAGINGYGSTMGYAAYPSPGSYTLFAEIIDIQTPKRSRAKIEYTNYTSVDVNSVAVEEFKAATLITPGTSVVTANYTSALRTAIDTIDDGGERTFKITYPDTHTEVFTGFVTDVDAAPIPIKGRMTLKFTLQITSKSVFT